MDLPSGGSGEGPSGPFFFYLQYFREVDPRIHRALICRGPNGAPNVGPELDEVHSFHADLWDFSQWGLSPDCILNPKPSSPRGSESEG